MNTYEFIGRAGVIQLECENLFSSIGSEIDDKRLELSRDSSVYFTSEDIDSIKVSIIYLKMALDNYLEIVNKYGDEISKQNNNDIKGIAVSTLSENISIGFLEDLIYNVYDRDEEQSEKHVTIVCKDNIKDVRYIEYDIPTGGEDVLYGHLYVVVDVNSNDCFIPQGVEYCMRCSELTKSIIGGLIEYTKETKSDCNKVHGYSKVYNSVEFERYESYIKPNILEI